MAKVIYHGQSYSVGISSTKLTFKHALY